MITVTSRQNILDVAIEHCGALEAAYELAVANGLCLTDDLVNGRELKETEITDSDVTLFYNVNKVKPATGITTDEINNRLGIGEGVEFWRIEYEFEVQ